MELELNGKLVYQGNAADPILMLEDYQAEFECKGWDLRLWHAKFVFTEHQVMCDNCPVMSSHDVHSQTINILPHLPNWIAPNRWDY